MNPSTTNPTTTTNPFQRYLALGWSVIPLQPKDKLPERLLLPKTVIETDPPKRKHSWKPYQTTAPTVETVEKWWRNPTLNVGIVTGAVSGIVVLDLDNEAAIAAAYQAGIPHTPTATTGKGQHIYFKYPETAIGNRANFAPVAGFDVRGEGGYVVAPPSLHPSGKSYEWLIAPEDTDLAEIPTWLHELLFTEAVPNVVPDHAPALTDAERDHVQQLVRQVFTTLHQTLAGGRNDQLNRSAFMLGQLIGADLADEQRLRQELRLAAQTLGLPHAEAAATIASGLQAGKRTPYRLPQAPDTLEADPKRETQTAALIRLGLQATLFHSPIGDLYARYPSERRYETHLISHPKSPFRLWLERQFYLEFGYTPGQVALQQALNHLEQVAYYEGETRHVFTRLGYVGDTIYLAIGDKEGHIVAIDREGWQLIQDAPVVFRSTRNANPLPLPTSGGSIEELRPLLNLPNEATWKLCIGWMVAALNPRGPYAHLVVTGEQGSGKSSLLRILRAFIDPAKAEENSEPRGIDDFMVTCLNNHIISYDNLSLLSEWLSDALCRLSTGAGLTKRMLYSDFDEVVIEAARPAILNSITPIVTRPDLLERSIVIDLPRIDADARLPERHFEQELAAVAPRVFGALLDAVVTALQRLEQVALPHLPRMADFTLWVEAAAPALGWEAGAFLKAYEANIRAKEEQVLESDEVAETLMAWIAYKVRQVGADHTLTMKQMYVELSALRQAGNDVTKMRDMVMPTKLPPEWPESPRGLLVRLARAKPMLRKLGLEYERGTRSNQGQTYVFRRVEVMPPES